MAAADYLKTARETPENSDAEVPEAEPRTIALTAEELSGLEGTKPGEDVVLEVTGQIQGDTFEISGISPQDAPDEAGPGMGDMAQKVATLVRPQMQISPS